MKSFKTVISELDAKDYKAEKDSDDEAKKYKPRSKGEEKFKDAHKKEVKDYPEGIGPQNEEAQLDEATMSGKEKKAYQDGRKAALSGKEYKSNPYDARKDGAKMKLAWSKGHNDARWDMAFEGNNEARAKDLDEQADPIVMKNIKKAMDSLIDQSERIDVLLYNLNREMKLKKFAGSKYASRETQMKLNKQYPLLKKVAAELNQLVGVIFREEVEELDERAPPIVTDNIKRAMDSLNSVTAALSSAGGKHASRGTQMKLKKQYALLKQVDAELKRIHAEALNEEAEEELEIFSEGAFDSIQKIAKDGKSARVKFDNGKSVDVDSESASAVVKMVNGLRSGKDKVVSDLEKSPENFMKVLDKAFG